MKTYPVIIKTLANGSVLKNTQRSVKHSPTVVSADSMNTVHKNILRKLVKVKSMELWHKSWETWSRWKSSYYWSQSKINQWRTLKLHKKINSDSLEILQYDNISPRDENRWNIFYICDYKCNKERTTSSHLKNRHDNFQTCDGCGMGFAYIASLDSLRKQTLYSVNPCWINSWTTNCKKMDPWAWEGAVWCELAALLLELRQLILFYMSDWCNTYLEYIWDNLATLDIMDLSEVKHNSVNFT